jgi:hypothetical protein
VQPPSPLAVEATATACSGWQGASTGVLVAVRGFAAALGAGPGAERGQAAAIDSRFRWTELANES